MTPIEIRLRCVEIADRLHIAGASEREKKVLESAQKIFDFVTENGLITEINPDVNMLPGLADMILSIVGRISDKSASPEPEAQPVAEELKAEKKAKVVKTSAEDKPKA